MWIILYLYSKYLISYKLGLIQYILKPQNHISWHILQTISKVFSDKNISNSGLKVGINDRESHPRTGRVLSFSSDSSWLSSRILRIWAAAQLWSVPLKIVFNVSRFKPALNWKRFLADLRRGSNSLNSGAVFVNQKISTVLCFSTWN